MAGRKNEGSLKKRRVQKKQEKQEETRNIEERISLGDFGASEDNQFTRLPLSNNTLKGLRHAKYQEMTEIQQASLPASLAKKDVLGAAKTGSGKTLAFLIPVLEILYRKYWTQFDGLGALIISPTRELACQIFEVLKKIGKFHELSAGLVIGGKSLKEEQELISRMNILIGTPGRLLQHMDQTAGFHCDNLQLLILDEADRILDMGFEKTMNAIIQNLPKERQTLLFSATQTKSVRDLARLSLTEPEYIAVHEKAEYSTPSKLKQYYIVCELQGKLDLLYSFLKKHLQNKILIFVSSCKQVRYVYESFRRMRPGISWMCLHGKQKQHSRLGIFEEFSRMKHAALLCTDVAGRGLDFPAVDWVLQLDCPEDGETYIHRVGRTARYEALGNGLLILDPSEEEGMLEVLRQKKVPIQKTTFIPPAGLSIRKQLAAFCSQDPELKYLAQKAFISYVRSVHFQKNKKIFDLSKLALDEYASSLGLPGTPRIKLIRTSQTGKKNMPYIIRQLETQVQAENSTSSLDKGSLNHESDMINEDSKSKKSKSQIERLFSRKNQDVFSEHYMKLNVHDNRTDMIEEDDDRELLTLSRKNHDINDLPEMVNGYRWEGGRCSSFI